jgi:hypothetical protein
MGWFCGEDATWLNTTRIAPARVSHLTDEPYAGDREAPVSKSEPAWAIAKPLWALASAVPHTPLAKPYALWDIAATAAGLLTTIAAANLSGGQEMRGCQATCLRPVLSRCRARLASRMTLPVIEVAHLPHVIRV